ncbi:tetratricopeptide repeat protein [Halanaerobium congolense]|uniref:tetratricopeptide repeat protein n=1 Tax=Halanaerobium congolense TaxID=54121 RepID=UPI001AAD1B87|nr:tetratricopeptide repeat protein [Halanaerobium congolense]
MAQSQKSIELNKKGFELLENEEIRSSITYFKKAIEINPDLVVVYNNLGSAYYRLSKYDKAIENFKKVIDKESNYAKAYFNIAASYYHKGNLLTAYKYYRKSKSIDEEYVVERLENPETKAKIKKESEKRGDSKAFDFYLDEVNE